MLDFARYAQISRVRFLEKKEKIIFRYRLNLKSIYWNSKHEKLIYE